MPKFNGRFLYNSAGQEVYSNKNLDSALVTLTHQRAAAYREEFDLLSRREATHANTMWQADYTPLDVWLLDEAGKPAKLYLAAIEDDNSRMIVGYRLSFQTAMEES